MWKLIGKGFLCAGALLLSTLSGIYAKNQAQEIMKGKKKERKDFVKRERNDNYNRPRENKNEVKRPKGPEMK